MKNKIGRYSTVWMVTATTCLLLQMLVLCIPQSAIYENCGRSARVFQKKPLFQEKITSFRNTTIDYYADCILLNIIYQMDTRHPFEAVVRDVYYRNETNQPNLALLEILTGSKQSNALYGRYWHGSMILVRPLLCIGDILFIYREYTFLLIIGIAMIVGLLIKKREYICVLCLTVSFLFAGGFWMTHCIEYANDVLLMVIFIYLLLRAETRDQVYGFCMAAGLLTCFFDFLTAETLTLTIPLCVITFLRSENKPKNWNGSIREILTAGMFWSVSYAGMFLVKWVLTSIYGKGTETISEKLWGRIIGNPLMAIFQNIRMLFPLPEQTPQIIGIILSGCYMAAFIWTVYFIVKNHKEMSGMLILAGVPYLRYLFLSEHSEIHCFFTYRQQMALVFVMLAAFVIFILNRKRKCAL